MLISALRRRSALTACLNWDLCQPTSIIARLSTTQSDAHGLPDVSSTTTIRAGTSVAHTVTSRARYNDIPVGSSLELQLGSLRAAAVSVVVGSVDAVKIFSWYKGHGEPEVVKGMIIHVIKRENDVAAMWAHVASNPPPGTLRILAVVPPRYFSLSITTAAGPVSIAAVKEADSVVVSTAGGSIKGGSLHAGEVLLDTQGGDVAVSQITGANVLVRTGGGSLAVQRLAGLEASIDAGSADVQIGACFVEKAGTLACGSLCAESVRGGTLGDDSCAGVSVQAGGGVTIGGVDGRVQIEAQGVVDLQINEGARHVGVRSSRGAVHLHVAPAVAVDLQLTGCGAASLPSDMVAENAGNSAATWRGHLGSAPDGREGPRSRLQRRSGTDDQHMPCQMMVSDAAGVTVRRRSWMEARRDAFMAGGMHARNRVVR